MCSIQVVYREWRVDDIGSNVCVLGWTPAFGGSVSDMREHVSFRAHSIQVLWHGVNLAERVLSATRNVLCQLHDLFIFRLFNGRCECSDAAAPSHVTQSAGSGS